MSDEVAVAGELPAAVPAPATSPQTAEGTAPAAGEVSPKPERSFTQAELNDIVEKRIAKERRKFEKRDSDLLRIALEGREREQQAKPAPSQNERPKRDDFETYEDFIRAEARHEASEEFKKSRQLFDSQIREQKARELFSEAQAQYLERQSKATAKYDDFDEIVSDPSLPINIPMRDAILFSELGPDIAYYLGKNRDEALRISRLPPLKAVIELGKIEAKIASAPAPKETSRAPAPIDPVSGKSASPSSAPSESDDITTWMKKRSRQVHGPRAK